MNIITWIFVQFLPAVGFVLALSLLSYIIRERRSPTSTLAWLMAIIFVPYLGVPFYLLFGVRKVKHQIDSKQMLPEYPSLDLSEGYASNGLQAYPGHGVFPPTSGNSIQLLSDGEEAYQEILELIEGAVHNVFIGTYILGNDKTGLAIINALAKKAEEGLKIRLLLDALGSVAITDGFLAPLRLAGGKVSFFMPMKQLPFRGRANLRNHRKMIIADCKTAVIGGMNLASEYMGPEASLCHWKDLSLLVEGPVVAHLNDIFRSDWKFAAKEELIVRNQPFCGANTDKDLKMQLIASGPDVKVDSLREAILTGLFRSTQRVWIVTPYFIPDDMLVESLCMAVRRGIDVRLIIPRKSNHPLADLVRRGYLEQLKEAGATVMLYNSGMLHAKALLIDDDVALVGSANMDFRSLLLNYEVALSIYSKQVIDKLKKWMYTLMKESSTLEGKQNFALGLVEGIGRLFAPLL